MSVILRGIPASGGVVLGDIYIYDPMPPSIPQHTIVPESVTAERERLLAAVASSMREVNQLRNHLQARIGEEEATLFDAHLHLLEEEELLAGAYQRIEQDLLNAERALWEATDEFAELIAELSDAYAQIRPIDMHDVRVRIVSHLQNQPRRHLDHLSKPVIVIAHELLPSDTAMLDPSLLVGVVTEQGGPISHMALLARQMGIPAVVGIPGLLATLRALNPPPQSAAIDGDQGTVEIDPDLAHQANYRMAEVHYHEHQQQLQIFRSQPAVTRDGTVIEVSAHVGGPQDARIALAAGADSVGLFRTEGLFLDRDMPPTEEEQVHAYRAVLDIFAGKKVIVRTLDVGGDKKVPYLNLAPESNPFLGLRGIRLCLCPPHLPLFRTQLRALLRAASPDHTSLWIMLPMVSDIGELHQTRTLLIEVEAELLAERKILTPILQQVCLGIMVETPAASLLVDVFAREVDFFSIGTNDLTQYTLACDRMNATLADPHRPFHPALIRSVAHIVTTARMYQRWVGVCGEMASNPHTATFLVGLGINELSMEPNALNAVKEAICRVTSTATREAVQQVLQATSAQEVEALLSNLIA